MACPAPPLVVYTDRYTGINLSHRSRHSNLHTLWNYKLLQYYHSFPHVLRLHSIPRHLPHPFPIRIERIINTFDEKKNEIELNLLILFLLILNTWRLL